MMKQNTTETKPAGLRVRIVERLFGPIIDEKVAERLLAAARDTDCHADRMGRIERMRDNFRKGKDTR